MLGRGPVYDMKQLTKMIQHDNVNAMITRLDGDDPTRFADQNNQLQALAEQSRLGIPVTISTDPRNAYHYSAHDDIDSASCSFHAATRERATMVRGILVQCSVCLQLCTTVSISYFNRQSAANGLLRI